MNELIAQPLPPARLPQLSGKWVCAYQVGWWLLALLAAGVIASSLYAGNVAAPVLGLRILKSAVVISVCAILLRRRRDDPVAAILSLALLSWAVSSSFDFAGGGLLPTLLDRVRYLLFTTALLLFPDGRWSPAWTRPLATAATAVCLLGLAEALALVPTRLFLPLAILCVAAAVGALISKFRAAGDEAVRQQLKWVALGLVAGIGLILGARAGAALSAAAPERAPAPVFWEALFQCGIVVIALGFLVSLLRYRLFDAESAISRSAALVGLTFAVVATFAGTEAGIEWLGQQYFGMGIGNISAAMAAAVAAVLLTPLHERITAWAEQRFERDLSLLKVQLPELLAELSARASVREIASAALPRISAATHVVRAAVLVDGAVVRACGVPPRQVHMWSARMIEAEPGRLRERDADDLLFPIRTPLRCPFGTVRGWLLLGPRCDGSVSRRNEIAALEAVRPALRQALFTAKARDDQKRRERGMFQAMSRRLDDLSQRVGELSSASPARARQG